MILLLTNFGIIAPFKGVNPCLPPNTTLPQKFYTFKRKIPMRPDSFFSALLIIPGIGRAHVSPVFVPM